MIRWAEAAASADPTVPVRKEFLAGTSAINGSLAFEIRLHFAVPVVDCRVDPDIYEGGYEGQPSWIAVV